MKDNLVIRLGGGAARAQKRDVALSLAEYFIEMGAGVSLLDAGPTDTGSPAEATEIEGKGAICARHASGPGGQRSELPAISIVVDESRPVVRLAELRAEFPRLLDVRLDESGANPADPAGADLYLNILQDPVAVCCQKIVQTLEILGLLSGVAGGDYNDEDERIIAERLRSLGYL